MKDVPIVGGKNASLGEMYRELTGLGVLLPNGFAVHVDAFKDSLDDSTLKRLHELLDPLNKSDPDFVEKLAKAGRECRSIVATAPLPPAASEEIVSAYHVLQEQYGGDITVAVRSSATAEDLPTASFAGQHDTYLNVHGEATLIDAVRRCNASLFTDRAISYRIDQGFDHFKVFLSACVMKMVRSDIASSGVMFTIDTETGFKDSVFITGAYGLGENVVQGTVDPDEYYVHKPTFRKGFRTVLRRRLGKKQMKMVYAASGDTREPIRNIPTPKSERKKFCLTDDQIMTLTDYAIKIEDHYSKLKGCTSPMDTEFAVDGLDGKVYIVQARPETVVSQRNVMEMKQYVLEGKATVLTKGRAVGEAIAAGNVRIINNTEELRLFKDGEILVADTTTPDWEPVLKRASGIITMRGGRTCHAAIVARELGVPAVVGCENACTLLENGQKITVNCSSGDIGTILEGSVPFRIKITNISEIKPTKTQMMINLGNPELAFGLSFLPCDGVGLARMEFIINEYIKVHPMALLHLEYVKDIKDHLHIARLLEGYSTGADYMIQKLSEGVGTLAAAFYPRPVVIRLSDFKSNEYASLIGGKGIEPEEANPMIGFRGASRYTHPAYEEGFALECKALRRVRQDMGLTNLIVMVPFCRTVKEAKLVSEVMRKYGLQRGENGLKVYMMCEIPNNVISIDEFAPLFDGISIGSNDLTQLTLGCDRDNEMIAQDFDERDPGVMKMLKLAIEGAKRNSLHTGICGQAPSDYPEIARYLVELGIDSISLIPDTLIKTKQMCAELEQELAK